MKLAKRALVLLLTLAMLVGCIPAFSVAAKEAVIEGVSTPTVVITSYEQIYVKDGLILLSTVYGNEGDGNIDLSTGVWNNRVGDDNIVIVGYAREEGGYNGWWLGANGKGVGYNYSDYTNYSSNRRTWGMRLPTSFLDESDVAVEYVFDYIGVDTFNTTDTEASGWGYYDGGHAAFSFQGLFITHFLASIGKNHSGLETRFHYGNVPFEKLPTSGLYTKGPNQGGISGYIQSWMLTKDETRGVEAREGASTLTINREYAPAGEHKIVSKSGVMAEEAVATTGLYQYSGFTVFMNGEFQLFLDNQRRLAKQKDGGLAKAWYAGADGQQFINTQYYSAADINAEGQAQGTKYTAFDAFFGFPAEIYAVRVYDRQISEAEAAQNHFADTVAWFGNAAIDLAGYSALSDMGKANVHAELATVAFTNTTADAVNAVIAKWAAKEIATTVYDEMYVQDGLVLLTSAFGADASLDLANGVWYNKAENGATNVKIFGEWTALNAGHGGIGYTATSSSSHKGNYLSFNGVVDSTGDFTVEYYAKLQGVGDYSTAFTNQKFGDWGDWYYTATEYRIVYNYANEGVSWLNGIGCIGNNYVWNTEKAITSAQVIDNEDNASYRYSYLDAVVHGNVNGLNIIGNTDWKGAAITKNTELQPTFFIARGLSSEVYAIRTYDRALSQAEVKYNAAVDACAYYGVDVSALKDYSYKVLMNTSFVNAAGMTDAASIAAVVATAATEAAAVASASVYNELYVQDGLNLLLLAYNDAVAFANVANGTWTNLAGAENGKIVDSSADISWTANSAANGGGITYKFASLTLHQNNRGKLGLTLPADTIGDEDFTVETVFVPHYVGDGSAIIPHDNNSNQSQWGAYDGGHSNFTMGNIHLAFFQPSIFNGNGGTIAKPSWSGSSANFRTMVCNKWGHEKHTQGQIGETDGFCKYGDAHLLGTYSASLTEQEGYTLSFQDKGSNTESEVVTKYVKDGMVKTATSFVVTRDVNDDKSFGFTVKAEKASYSAAYGAEYYAANDDLKIPFDMFYSFAATVYAIRAYDRVLSENEIAQNKVVDVLAKTGADVSELLAMSETERAIILTVCAPDVSYTMSKAEAQAVLDNALASTFIPETSKDAYSDLYVQNGLQALYTAFDGGEKTVDFKTGIWYATGSDQFITLKGDKWEKSNGGIGYRMLASKWSGNTSNDYIDLGALTSNEFTVEVAQTMVGLTDEDGNRVEIDGNVQTNYKWGVYATQYSSYEFGYFKATSFIADVTTAGNGIFATRVSFNPGHWGSDNGKYWIGGANFSWADAKYMTVPTTLAFTQEAGIFTLENTKVYTHANREQIPEGETFGEIEGVTYSHTLPGYQLSVLRNGEVATSANTVTGASDTRFGRPVTYEDENGVEQTGYIPYLSAAEANASSIGKPMKVMSSMPGDVYAIRIYDCALSVAEAAWNSFIDIAAYTEADVSALNGLSDAQKAEFGKLIAENPLSYTNTKDEVEAAAAELTGAMATYATGALGYQKGNDGTSLRIWATANLVTVQDATALGMEIKVTGDAEKVLSGETDRVFRTVKNGDKIVCSMADDTFYFAAVVEGIPADKNFTFVITPYAVVNGVKVYGESKTLEWPAVENQE